MSNAVWCQRCGRQLPPGDALGGRCPRCMLALGFESAPGNAEELEATISPADGKDLEGVSLPSVIGRYRILRLIGEGGMGAVYEAEQSQPRRTVALKIIKPGLASPELMRRFEQESQALGRLQHPGIAQIYEAGTVDTGFGPQPYFAMELIHGLSPRDYAEAHHLSTGGRLEIMAKICEAVHHAHQRGLIHRDLKPANILIDETGQPKILDFGVARATDSDARATIQTDLGQLVGTLAYMSPEQVLADPLDIDTRSDVYSLGVILYEFLSGRLPYPISKKLHENIQTIREADPAKLSLVNRTFRGDIENIVAKALEKDRARRYPSAAGMAGDIRRYLKDEPIVARPPSTSYQLRKYTRRHKVLVSGLAAICTILIAAVVVARMEMLREKAERAMRESEKLSHLATVAGQAAQFAAQGKYSAAEQLYVSLLADDRLILGTDNPITLSHMISLASVNTSRLPLSTRNYAAAEELSKEIVAIQMRTLGEQAPGTLESESNLAKIYSAQSKYPEAEKLWTKVVAERSKVIGEENVLTLADMISLRDTYEAMGNLSQSRIIYQKVTTIADRLAIRKDPLGQQILTAMLPDPYAKLPAKFIGGRIFKEDRIDGPLTFLDAGPPVTVSGRVIAGGGNGVVPPFSLSFAGDHARLPAEVQPNGTFKVHLPAGDYRVTPSAMPDGYYLDSIQMGLRDLSVAPVRLEGAALGEIVVRIGLRRP